jgi:selenide,water dikinase
VQAGIAPGGTHANRRFLASWVEYDPKIPEWQQLLLCDAQTSGGLLAALPGTHAAEVVRHLRYHGLGWAGVVGCIEDGRPGAIRVRLSPESSWH